MKVSGSIALLLLALTTAPAFADSSAYDQQGYTGKFSNHHSSYLLAHGGDRHYHTNKHRKYRNNRRHHRNHYRSHGGYDYHLDFHVYPYYRSDRRYRHHKRNYRRHYRHQKRHHRYRDYRCGYRNDGVTWLAGAVVASELLHYAFDNPQDEWHYSGHRDYSADDWADDWSDADFQEYAPVTEVDHEQHYRSYHATRYGG
ncbi:hypothetical protein ACVBEJ_00295 [Porticoccus sp. GXU_MW_L64]